MAVGVPYGGSWLVNQDGSAMLDTKRVRAFRRELGFSDTAGRDMTEIIARYSKNDEEVLASYRSASVADAVLRGLNAAIIGGDVAAFTWLPDEPEQEPSSAPEERLEDLSDPFAPDA